MAAEQVKARWVGERWGVMINRERCKRIVYEAIQTFELNLADLIVFTEAATGSYLYTPIIASLAGAKHVYAVTQDSHYGGAEHVRSLTFEVASSFHVEDNISILFQKSHQEVSQCDIITNSGFVRPIDREMISWMKPTAVIPLMWEPWEFREEDLDLEACREKGILVLGTNEHQPPLDLFPSNGFICMRLLFDAGIEVHHSKLLILGSFPVAESILRVLRVLDLKLGWVCPSGHIEDTSLSSYLIGDKIGEQQVLKFLEEADALVVADLTTHDEILGSQSSLSGSLLKKINPSIVVAHICGGVNAEELRRNNVYLVPDRIMPPGHMSVSADYLGPKLTIFLNAAGLKVGEAMARARLSGKSIEESVAYAIKSSPAMTFGG